ncbi:MAG: hypothetical protein JZU50_14575 [Desulfobulbaceae bacterium]|nr:hypothetical protein [Desulfobulbaceae bacterium]
MAISKSVVLTCLTLTMGCWNGVFAAEYAVSGFGTVGGAISDQATVYQRYVDDTGTLMRDSLLGVQLDAKFNDQWGATTQVVIAPRSDDDTGVDPQFKWTFLSYRPTNDWFFRLGRLSLGGLLNQQNMDVGVSYDMARLPAEVYFVSSYYDYDGASIAKTWSTTNYEITLDGSFGVQNSSVRTYDNGSKAAVYIPGKISGGALVLTINDFDRALVRAGWHMTDLEPDDPGGFASTVNFVPLGNGQYTLGKPEYTSRIRVNSFFLGTRFPLGEFMAAGECIAVIPDNIEPAPPYIGGYVSVSRQLGNWTPYLTHARIWTTEMDTWRKVRGATPVPQFGVAQADIDNAASSMLVSDQNSWMLGASYAFTPKQKLKAEVMRTHVGERASMFDGDLAHEDVMIYSLSYNFSF